MAIPLQTDPGGIFRMIGRNWFCLKSQNGARGTADLSGAGAVSLGTGIDNIAAQYEGANRNLIDSLFSQRDQQRANFSIGFNLSNLAANSLIQLADIDTILNPRTLQNALTVLISQMIGSSDTVNANAVSVGTPTAGGSNVGNAVMTASLKNAAGKLQEYVFAETLTATCQSNAQDGSAAAGAERWGVVGDLAATSGSLGWDWPAGSGANFAVQARTAAAGILTNGNFETWTLTDIPDGWTIVVGTASSTVFESTSPVYRDSAALRILGNGSELTSLRQPLSLKPSTVYAFNLFQRVSSVPAAGVLSIDLYDGTSVINDDAGTANQVTKNLTASTTSFAALNGFFRTPSVLPANIYLRVRLTTALDSGKSVYLDELCLTSPVQAYPGGPYVAIFAGNTNSVKGDTFTATVSNDYGGKLQQAFWAMFNMPSLGLQLPSNSVGGETIPDSLVY